MSPDEGQLLEQEKINRNPEVSRTKRVLQEAINLFGVPMARSEEIQPHIISRLTATIEEYNNAVRSARTQKN